MGVNKVKKLKDRKYKKFKSTIVARRLTLEHLCGGILSTTFNSVPILLYLSVVLWSLDFNVFNLIYAKLDFKFVF